MNVTILSLWAQKLFRPNEPQPFGGAELQLVFLARALADIPGVTVRFITRGQGPPESFLSDRIHVHKLAYRRCRYTRSLLGLWDCYRACMLLPTDVFIQRGGGFETGIAGLASQISCKPFLFMTSSTWDVDGTHETQRGSLYGKVYMSGLRRSTAIVTQTQYQHDLLLQRYGKNSIVLRSAHPMPGSIPPEKEGVIWVGRCEPCKNPERFVDLAENLPGIPCTMVCPAANLPDLFNRIASRAASVPNLDFLPGVSFEETEALFARHRLMVNTSTQEGYPNTFVQAFKWGLPVVSTLFDPDGLLESKKLGFLTGDCLKTMAARILSLLNDPVLWKEYSNRVRSFALENHDVTAIARQLYELLQALRNPSSSSIHPSENDGIH